MKKFIILCLFLSLSFAGNIQPNGINQGDLYTLLNNVRYSLVNYTGGSASVTPSATGPTINIQATYNYVVNGLNYSASPSSSIAVVAGNSTARARTKQTYAVTPINYYGIYVNASGQYYFNDSRANYQPAGIEGYAPVGAIKVQLTSTNTAGFTLGTTNWSATSQSVTVQNIATFTSGPSKVSLTGL